MSGSYADHALGAVDLLDGSQADEPAHGAAGLDASQADEPPHTCERSRKRSKQHAVSDSETKYGDVDPALLTRCMQANRFVVPRLEERMTSEEFRFRKAALYVVRRAWGLRGKEIHVSREDHTKGYGDRTHAVLFEPRGRNQSRGRANVTEGSLDEMRGRQLWPDTLPEAVVAEEQRQPEEGRSDDDEDDEDDEDDDAAPCDREWLELHRDQRAATARPPEAEIEAAVTAGLEKARHCVRVRPGAEPGLATEKRARGARVVAVSTCVEDPELRRYSKRPCACMNEHTAAVKTFFERHINNLGVALELKGLGKDSRQHVHRNVLPKYFKCRKGCDKPYLKLNGVSSGEEPHRSMRVMVKTSLPWREWDDGGDGDVWGISNDREGWKGAIGERRGSLSAEAGAAPPERPAAEAVAAGKAAVEAAAAAVAVEEEAATAATEEAEEAAEASPDEELQVSRCGTYLIPRLRW